MTEKRPKMGRGALGSPIEADKTEASEVVAMKPTGERYATDHAGDEVVTQRALIELIKITKRTAGHRYQTRTHHGSCNIRYRRAAIDTWWATAETSSAQHPVS